MNVLSLCDGIATGRYVLEKLGIKVDKYYAAEIEPSAIKVAQKNFPDIIEVGDVTKVDGTKFKGEVDLVIFGSPCTSLSITMSKTRKNLDGKSKLFFDCHRILKEVQPKYFFMENVYSMKDECKNIITEYMGVQPTFVNSACFTAQDRKRYYWTNISHEDETQLRDCDLVIKDILQPEEDIAENLYYKQPFDYYGDKQVCATLHINGHDIIKRVHSPNFKCHTLTTCGGGNTQKKVYVNGRVRKLSVVEYERLMGLPDNYTEGVSNTARYSACGNGWSVPVIEWFFKGLKDV